MCAWLQQWRNRHWAACRRSAKSADAAGRPSLHRLLLLASCLDDTMAVADLPEMLARNGGKNDTTGVALVEVYNVSP